LAALPICATFDVASRHTAARGVGTRSHIMRWSKPMIREIAVGAEINSYACAGIV